MQYALEINDLALSPEFGLLPNEVATLRDLVTLKTLRMPMMLSELKEVRATRAYYSDWWKWFKSTFRKTDEEVEKMGPEPVLKNYLTE